MDCIQRLQENELVITLPARAQTIYISAHFKLLPLVCLGRRRQAMKYHLDRIFSIPPNRNAFLLNTVFNNTCKIAAAARPITYLNHFNFVTQKITQIFMVKKSFILFPFEFPRIIFYFTRPGSQTFHRFTNFWRAIDLWMTKKKAHSSQKISLKL